MGKRSCKITNIVRVTYKHEAHQNQETLYEHILRKYQKTSLPPYFNLSVCLYAPLSPGGKTCKKLRY